MSTDIASEHMKPTVTSTSSEWVESCFKPPTGNEPGVMDASTLLDYFEKFALPYPFEISLNQEEVTQCKTIADIIRMYFSLGYRCGALDHFLKVCNVTEVTPNKYVFSGSHEHLAFDPLKEHNVLSNPTDES